MAEPICPIHKKAMKIGKFGYFCPTPLQKDAAGKVLAWCKAKPEDLVVEDVELPSETVKEPTKEAIASLDSGFVDWDKIAEGKVRNAVAIAFIGKLNDPPILTPETVTLMDQWVAWIMSGEYMENVADADLDRIFNEVEIEKKAAERAEIDTKIKETKESLF